MKTAQTHTQLSSRMKQFRSALLAFTILTSACIADELPKCFVAGGSLLKTAVDEVLTRTFKAERQTEGYWNQKFSFYGKIDNYAAMTENDPTIMARWWTDDRSGISSRSFSKMKGYPDFYKVIPIVTVDQDGYFEITDAVGNELHLVFKKNKVPTKTETYYFSNSAREGFTEIQKSTPIIIALEPKKEPQNVPHTEQGNLLIPYTGWPVDQSILTAIQMSKTTDSDSQLVSKIVGSKNPSLYLRASIALQRFDLADSLLDNGLSLNIVDSAELSLFHLAAMRPSGTSKCEFLWQRGAPINYMDESGYTPLDYAIQQGNIEVVRYLSTIGAKTSNERRNEKRDGLGIKLTKQKDQLFAVDSFTKVSPARESGLIQVGDKISKIDGIDIKGRSIYFITQRISGNKDDVITLELIDTQGITKTCVLKRGLISH
ncbi:MULTISPECIES: ankyrin repeat domain-containing protein [unclassified Lentimonas]|uniref:ankyrin repeat domain-containing protein n=1 Tax=unclassified Lentimonas TaxID=2630993 RepID=UPI00132A6442|nr:MULTISPECIES: ankyrin repeat domain-containing protein [unclassified Lentimonas]CAA6690133.1 Unannotated [Lentimonas sp. CC19]CAA6690905.1 Unannotated [Lentimonas sp. CC10]CAA7070743.1 Unannotated [Lentimonas sp. CC11]